MAMGMSMAKVLGAQKCCKWREISYKLGWRISSNLVSKGANVLLEHMRSTHFFFLINSIKKACKNHMLLKKDMSFSLIKRHMSLLET
jgi:hypothetical protein